MKIQKLSEKRLKRFWEKRLPEQAGRFERFLQAGLLPQDFELPPLELVCACSLMVERRTIYDALQSIDRLNDESLESGFEAEFFKLMDETITDLERAGMRAQARKLRKLGQGVAAMQSQGAWQSHWKREAEKKALSGIKDEPFLPQKG